MINSSIKINVNMFALKLKFKFKLFENVEKLLIVLYQCQNHKSR